ncbi:hypothetical protein ACFLVS_03425 [Chloroflexota bacterium]
MRWEALAIKIWNGLGTQLKKEEEGSFFTINTLTLAKTFIF